MDRATWLAERRKGVGSSDAPAVCGVSPWADPLTVYLDKIGELPAEDELAPHLEWGLRHEPAIAQAYEEKTGHQLTAPDLCQHAEYPWMLASIDRMREDGRIVELKTASQYKADEWGTPGTDQVPDSYLVQTQHQMAVSGAQVADIAVLIGNCDFRVYTVERCEPLLEVILWREKEFWRRVQEREPPEPDFSLAGAAALIEILHGGPEGITVLEDMDLTLADDYQTLGAKIRELQEARDVAKAHLLHRLAGAATGVLPDGRTIKRQRVERKAYSVEATEYVNFLITKAKVTK